MGIPAKTKIGSLGELVAWSVVEKFSKPTQLVVFFEFSCNFENLLQLCILNGEIK